MALFARATEGEARVQTPTEALSFFQAAMIRVLRSMERGLWPTVDRALRIDASEHGPQGPKGTRSMASASPPK